MKIGLLKVGQKVYFNRSCPEVQRSNTNGNFGTYKLFSLLIEKNPNDTFYMLSDSDLSKGTYPNAYPSIQSLHFLDVIIIVPGILSKTSDKHLLYEMINYPGKIIILSDDPRCLRSTLPYIPQKPYFIGMQNDGFVLWKGEVLRGYYVPLELAQCYKGELKPIGKKNRDLIVIANTTENNYRTKVLQNLLKGIDAPIFGRLTEPEKVMLGPEKCVGEVDYKTMQHELATSISTLLVPIKKGLVTSKYIEAIQNYTVPIFHSDYNTDALELKNYQYIIRNADELKQAIKNIRKNPYKTIELLNKLRFIFVENNITGDKLNSIIYNIILNN